MRYKDATSEPKNASRPQRSRSLQNKQPADKWLWANSNTGLLYTDGALAIIPPIKNKFHLKL